MHIKLAKNAFQILNKILRNKRLLYKIKTRVLNCNEIPVLLYGSEYGTISPQIKRKLKAAEIWLYRRTLRIP